jgi:DNA-binding response OmpR family regulator
MRILLLEDHCRLAESITKGLARFGFGVDAFPNAGDGVNAASSMTYDAIVLDLGLPDRDGLEVLGEMRGRNLTAPILILTARDDIDDRVAGLDAGADDYVVKPFAMTELAARLRALLRRPGGPLPDPLSVGNLQLDPSSRQVTVKGAAVHFSVREIETLEMLMRREGQVVSRQGLENGLYGLKRNVSPNSVEVLISRLRRRLHTIDAKCAIHTLHGIGYLLKEDNS